MTRGSWAASGRSGAPAGRAPRVAGSWAASLVRAREAWDGLTGGPADRRCAVCKGACAVGSGRLDDAGRVHLVQVVYSDAAAASILGVALALWADTAAGMTDA
ncbi:MAG TPA: hypothetical protein VGK17_00690 [Propionicimonas sp.]